MKVNSKLLFIGLSAAVLSLGLYGCAKKAPSSNVIASVNGKPITVKKFKAEMSKLPPQLQDYIKTSQGEKRLIKSLVDRQILVNEAIKEGVNRSKAYKEQLSDFKKGILVQLLLKKEVASKVKVTDKAARAFYKKNFLSFNLPSVINVSYIQVNSLQQARLVYGLIHKGQPFATVAKKYSTAGNAANGGLLGPIKFEQTTPPFNNAAFSIGKIGGYSKIVKVGDKFDIIKLNSAVTGKPKPFSAVKTQIVMIMKQKEGAKILKNFVAKLKKKAHVKYYYKNLPSFTVQSAATQSAPRISSENGVKSKENKAVATKKQ